MEEKKYNDDGEPVWFAGFTGMMYGIGFAVGVLAIAVAILFLFPGVRELLERLATSFFG